MSHRSTSSSYWFCGFRVLIKLDWQSIVTLSPRGSDLMIWLPPPPLQQKHPTFSPSPTINKQIGVEFCQVLNMEEWFLVTNVYAHDYCNDIVNYETIVSYSIISLLPWNKHFKIYFTLWYLFPWSHACSNVFDLACRFRAEKYVLSA